MGGRVAIALAIASLTAPAAAVAEAPSRCPGDPIDADKVITGEFSSKRQGSFVFLPFKVPSDRTAVRVKYCYDQPESPTSAQLRHTLDLGLYEPRDRSDEIWETDEFRGWGGSGYRDVTVSPEGFSGTKRYEEDPKDRVPGKTTRSFLPGAIPRGHWAVELGLAAIVSKDLGDTDGKVAWRVEIERRGNPKFANNPYEPTPYDASPARRETGWYAGDFHVHAEHSGDADVTMDETFDYAFRSLSDGGAGLDFLTLSDHNTTSAWGEIGRLQDDHPKDLVVRSQEVTTYRGHANQHASGIQSDYRTGALLERRRDGELRQVREPRGAGGIFRRVHRAGGFTQINHPTIFPSSVPPFAFLCRGCSWDYSAGQTHYSRVDAIEIATGPPGLQQPIEIGPNPFTTTAIDFWEDKLERGHKIAAVGSSDSHDADEPDSPTEAPVGTATTVVRAGELSEAGVDCAVRSGHTYVKVFGNDGPDLRFTARPPGSSDEAIMGDTLADDEARFRARVIGGAGDQLVVLKDNVPVLTVPVVGGDFMFPFDSLGPGRYRLQVQRASSIEAVSSPIYLKPNAEPRDRPCGPSVVG